MRTIKNKFLKQSEKSHRFAITPIFGPVVLIAITIAVYHYLTTHDLFPLWIDKIHFVLKIFIAFEIIIGSARTFMMPLFTLIVGLLLIFTSEAYQINLIPLMDCWQIVFAALFGFIITFLIKF